MMKRIFWVLGALLTFSLVALAVLAALNLRGEDKLPNNPVPFASSPALIERGEYLARAGNCISCHTVQGGVPYAGGRGIETPFGLIFASNLTPDPETGLGAWTSSEFWRAMHNGRSKDGRLLYPAFPYTNYTLVTRADSDAIYAYLQSLPASAQPNRAHALDFPYNTQLALAGWRALFFKAGSGHSEPMPTALSQKTEADRNDWLRGAYLVNGLGHCAACHTPRNALGGSSEARAFTGGLIPVQNWYAPALNAPHEAGVADWPVQDVVALLKTGVAPQGVVTGPMAEVVFKSTQYLSDDDARSMAVYLRALPQHNKPAAEVEAATKAKPDAQVLARGGAVYDQQCAQCHGAQGEGQAGAFPALAGSRAVTMDNPTNVLRLVIEGGYLPATAGNPRPHGMPPFLHALSNQDLAAVTTFIRNAWGNQAPSVGTIDVYRARERRGS